LRQLSAADHWLSSLVTSGFGSDKLVPLALHVDYWNDLGWTDRFSKAGFSQRQREAAHAAAAGVIYTPQVVLDGMDLAGWGNVGRFASNVANGQVNALQRIYGSLPRSRVPLCSSTERFALQESSRRDAVGAWVAVFENRLVTRVVAGENGGRTLEHDYVVRTLHGPIAISRDGITKLNLQLPLDATWKPCEARCRRIRAGLRHGFSASSDLCVELYLTVARGFAAAALHVKECPACCL
jgi:hypothetical protein